MSPYIIIIFAIFYSCRVHRPISDFKHGRRHIVPLRNTQQYPRVRQKSADKVQIRVLSASARDLGRRAMRWGQQNRTGVRGARVPGRDGVPLRRYARYRERCADFCGIKASNLPVRRGARISVDGRV